MFPVFLASMWISGKNAKKDLGNLENVWQIEDADKVTMRRPEVRTTSDSWPMLHPRPLWRRPRNEVKAMSSEPIRNGAKPRKCRRRNEVISCKESEVVEGAIWPTEAKAFFQNRLVKNIVRPATRFFAWNAPESENLTASADLCRRNLATSCTIWITPCQKPTIDKSHKVFKWILVVQYDPVLKIFSSFSPGGPEH